MNCVKDGRNCFLLSERTRHVQILADLLRAQNIPVHVLLGGQTNTQMKSQMAALKAAPCNAPLVICATGKFIGEGFDDSRLDTLFLDEGFGSLDEESLEQAIRVLSGLTEGDRLVGIISHVAALKDRIDHQVLVKKARSGGSTVELIV